MNFLRQCLIPLYMGMLQYRHIGRMNAGGGGVNINFCLGKQGESQGLGMVD